jgi:hypothetical protein
MARHLTSDVECIGHDSRLSRRHAGFTSPGWRPSAVISADESALTTLPTPVAAKCVVASMASPATATAALKYLNNGASGKVAPTHSPECAGMTIWTTQPAGGVLSGMVPTCAHGIELVQFCLGRVTRVGQRLSHVTRSYAFVVGPGSDS